MASTRCGAARVVTAPHINDGGLVGVAPRRHVGVIRAGWPWERTVHTRTVRPELEMRGLRSHLFSRARAISSFITSLAPPEDAQHARVGVQAGDRVFVM